MQGHAVLSLAALVLTSVTFPARAEPAPSDFASDHPVAAEPVAESSNAWSYEVRADLLPASYRWSRINEPFDEAHIADRSLYFSLGLGLRVIKEGGHGVVVDGAYRFDADFDGINAEQSFPIRFSVAHLGYAYRYVGKRSLRDRRAWAITPHVSVSTGVARKLHFPLRDQIPTRSPVFGARVGIDFDLHVHRFFLGWGVSYEVLHHTRGALTASHFLAWNFIPVLRIGANFGRRVR